MQEDPLTPAVHLEFAYACARAGDFPAARASWEHFLSVSPRDAVAADVHRALNALNELQQLLEAHANG